MSSLNYRMSVSVIAATASYMLLASPAIAQSSGGVLAYLPMPILHLISYVLLFAFAVLAVLWWRRKQQPADALLDEGFTITPSADGKSVQYSIRGAGIGIGVWVVFIFSGLFSGAMFTMALTVAYKLSDDGSLRSFLVMMAIAIGSAFLWDRVRKRNFIFEITDHAVQAPNGKNYARQDISEILIRNRGTIAHGATPQSTTFVVGTGVTGMAMAATSALSSASSGIGKAVEQSLGQSLAKRSNEVCIRHGRNVIPLAKYLREDDAIALFDRVQASI